MAFAHIGHQSISKGVSLPKRTLRVAMGGVVVLLGATVATVTLLPNAYATTPSARYTAVCLASTGSFLVTGSNECDSTNSTVTATASVSVDPTDIFNMHAEDGTHNVNVHIFANTSNPQFTPGTFPNSL